PAISKIRLANIQYENGNKRINDELFIPDGNNTAITLENGGGKTVFIQLLIQAILPKHTHAGRKIIETLELSNSPAHVAVEWILNDNPRKYLLTAVSLYLKNNQLSAHIFLSEYDYNETNTIEKIPFSVESNANNLRAASHGEINEYYLRRKNENVYSKTFDTLKEYHSYLEKNYNISNKEWYSISKINSSEGGIEAFFENCSTTDSLVNNLLIPTVEDALEGENAEMFTETFENHRKHLQEYKILKSTIEENKKIRDYLDKYVDVYKEYYLADKEYKDEKLKFNAYYIFIEKEKEKTTKILSELETSLKSTSKDIELNNRLLSSLEIAEKNVEYKKLEKDKDELYSKFKFQEADVELNKTKLSELKLIGKLQEKRILEEEIEGYKRQIRNIDMDEQLEDLVKEKKAIMSQLSYVYKKLVTEINELINNLNKKTESLEFEKNTLAKLIVDKNLDIDIKKEEKHQLIGENNTMISQIDNDFNKLSGMESRDDIKKFKKSLLEDITESTSQKNNKVTLVNRLSHDNESFMVQRKELSSNILNNQKKLNTRKSKISEIKIISERLKTQYFDLFENELMDGVLYNSRNTISKDIANRLQIMHNSKEQALIYESEYQYKNKLFKDQDVYFVESKIINLLSNLKQKFKYIEVGTEYIKNIQDENTFDVLAENYKFWPSTLVCFEDDKKSVKEYLIKYSESFSYPVFLISDKDIKELISKTLKATNILTVAPTVWSDNLSESIYRSWKDKNSSLLIEAKGQRVREENKIRQYENLESQINDFFVNYPKELFDSLSSEIYELENLKNDNDKMILELELEYKIETNVSMVKNYEEEIRYATELISHLNRQVDYATNIIKYQSALSKNQTRIYNIDEQIEVNNYEKTELNSRLNVILDNLKDFDGMMHDYDKKLAILKEETYYRQTIQL
ncbi:MAG: hypothetical protein WBA54_03640, partial [Acidaminobacteraceae bacterium]